MGEERLLRPGEYWNGVDVESDPAFQRHGPVREPARRVSAQERLFARAMYAAEMVHRMGLPVTADTLHQENREIPLKTWAQLLASPLIQEGLEERGIPVVTLGGLTPEQMAAAAIYLDTTHQMTHAQRLRAAGVTAQKWRSWMRQPLFAQYIGRNSEDILQDAVPMFRQRLVEQADKGEKWAIELGLEITGVHDRRNHGVDLNQVLMLVFASLDDAGVDQELMKQIAEKLRSRLGGAAPAHMMPATVTVSSTPVADGPATLELSG